ncbi:MAG: hypothetical protein ACN4GZ_05370 [Acidimicrobiales bacterium]
MRTRSIVLAVLVSLAGLGCSNLGLGEAACTSPDSDISAATILNVQAVPTAKYTPCLHELRLGWDSVIWFAEDGRAGFEIQRSFVTFLTATVTESCDVSNADLVSTSPDIDRYEDVDFQAADIHVTIVPSGEDPLFRSRQLVHELEGTQLRDRPLILTIDDQIEQSVSTRLDRALKQHEYVLIIDEVDAEEHTVQLRSNNPNVVGRGLPADDALDLIEEHLPEVYYRGSWYFTFDGGCITYRFDAKGPLAETVAADAQDALGFFNAEQLRDVARNAGYYIE